ncbi:hypothetical protein FACS1894199_11060 [Bacteroidia bacterium]|nr:hypothetical protein FACS1894199_11060 [Bacteroidia bacterium]
MTNKTLYIIGNGFDLYHDLPTKYSDFREYLQKHNSSLEYLLETSFSVDLWSDFENHLSKLDLDAIFSDNYDILPDEDSDRDGDKYPFIDKMEQIKNDLTVGLKNALRDWILSLEYPANIDDLLLNLDKEAIFLTFNYSNTLEQFYKVKSNQIIYLHNKAEKLNLNNIRPKERYYIEDNSDIIIGHNIKKLQFKIPKVNRKGFKTAYSCEEGFEQIKLYDNFKDTEQIISEHSCFFNNLYNIEKIIIIGHSLSDVDLQYFQEISKNTINAPKYKITYFGQDKFDEIKNQSAKFLPNSTCIEYINVNLDEVEIDDIKLKIR